MTFKPASRSIMDLLIKNISQLTIDSRIATCTVPCVSSPRSLKTSSLVQCRWLERMFYYQYFDDVEWIDDVIIAIRDYAKLGCREVLLTLVDEFLVKRKTNVEQLLLHLSDRFHDVSVSVGGDVFVVKIPVCQHERFDVLTMHTHGCSVCLVPVDDVKDVCFLLRCGDVETNPGPVQSRFLRTPPRYNCSRGGANRENGYRYRSDPQHRQDWDEEIMRRAERAFHSKDAPKSERVRAVADAICMVVSQVHTEGSHAQIFGLGVQDVLGVSHITASVDRAVDVAAAGAERVREDISAGLKRIPELVGQVLETQAGFLPVSVKSVLVCVMSLIGLYVVKQLIGVASEIFSIIYGFMKITFRACATVFVTFDEWLTYSEAQVNDEKDSLESFVSTWIPRIIPMLLSLVVAGSLTKVPSRDNSPDAWLRRLDLLPRAVKGFGEIHGFSNKWLSSAIEYGRELVSGPNPLAEKFGLPAVTSWMDEVVEMSKDLNTTCRTRSGCEKVKQLWYRGDRLLKEYRNVMDRDTVDNVKRMLQLAARMRETAINTYGRPKGVRAVPQLVWLVGESQIGKSTMQYFLAAELLAEFGMAKDIEDQMYMRAVEQEYADGYNGQYVWVIDDAFQMRDSPAQPNIEFFEIIRAVGNFPYALHMADISQKANTYFDSKSLICSTNNENLDIQSLTYPDAVFNRFAFAYKVRVKPKYQKIKIMRGQPVITLDKEKALRDAPVIDGVKSMFNLNVYEFVRFDPCNPGAGNEELPVDFQTVARVLRADLRERDNQSTNLSAMLKTYAGRIDRGLRGDEDDADAQIGTEFQSCVDETRGDYFFDTPVWGTKTLGDLKVAWQAVCAEEDTLENAGIKSLSLVAVSELAWLECSDATLLRDVDWTQVMTPQEDLAEAFVKRSKKEDSKIVKMAIAIRDGFKKYVGVLRDAWEKIGSPIFAAASSLLVSSFESPLLTLGAVSLGYFLMRRWLKRSKGAGVAESDQRANQPRAKMFTKLATRAGFKSSKPKTSAEMAEDISQQDVIMKLRQNQYMVFIIDEHGEERFFGNGLVVTGAILMIPNHFVTAMKEIYRAKTVCLRRHDALLGFEYPMEVFLEHYVYQEDGDVAFVNLFQKMPPRANLLKLFAEASASTRLYGDFKATLSGFRVGKTAPELVQMKGTVCPQDEKSYSLDGHTITVRNCYQYDIDTMKGDCGMILTVCDKASVKKIIGMHVAGSPSGKNWATALWREQIEDALKEFPSNAQLAGSYTHVVPKEMTFAGEFLPVGELKNGPPELARSQIVPSSLHRAISDPTTVPAKLRPFVSEDGSLIDPLENGIKKTGRFTPWVDKDKLDIAKRDLLQTLRANHRDRQVDLRVLTYEEAVAGIPGDELMNGVSRVTSPGYPYTQEPNRGKGKTKWMGHEEYDFNSEAALQLRRDVEDLIDKAKRGERLDVLWIDTLKDERRPIPKVRAGKTRVFSNGPMHFNIAFRMYFQSAFSHIQNNRIYNECGVGMDVWSAEWEELYKWLRTVGQKGFDGDIGNLDGSLAAQILWGAEWTLDGLYPPNDEDSRVREALWTAIVYATRYFRGLIYMCTHGVPSGVPGTSIIDSLALSLIFRVHWLSLAPAQYKTMAAFHEHVRLIVYGDDNIVTVSTVASEFYNMNTMVEAFANIGMEYTDAAKSGEYEPLKHLDETQFLKRRFHWSPYLNRHTCPADLESRLEILNWTKKNNVIDTKVIEKDSIQAVFQELAAFSDPDLYRTYVDRILLAANAVNLKGVHDEGFFHYHIPRNERL